MTVTCYLQKKKLMPNILLDCERMKYPNTGLYTFCSELGSALLETAGPDEELYFYMPRKAGAHFGPRAHYIWQYPMHKFYLPHQQKINVWHTTYQASRYNTLQRGCKKVLTIHDLNFLYEEKAKGREKKIAETVQKAIDRADQLVAISRFAQKDVLQHLNTRNKPFRVIYNGAEVQEFPGFDAPRLRPAGAFLFAIGTILPKKNFHVLPPLLRRHPELELIIAGNIHHEYYERIMKAALLHGVQKQVKIIGGITPQEKYWYYQHCQAFLFPSLAEGFGIPPIEAMHFGKPVFLSDKTSLPEIGGDKAYYFTDFDADAMQAVFEQGMQDHAVRQREAEIREHAAQFSWRKAAGEYMALYRELF